MNGVHDMGGMQDMGPVRPEKNEPVFHAAWEGRVLAMYVAIDGDWPSGSGRYQRELIAPADYLRMSYYERWLTSLSELLVRSGMVTRTELETGVAQGGNTKGRHMLRAEEVAPMIAAGGASNQPGNVDEFELGRDYLCRFCESCRNLDPLVRYGDPADIRFDRAKRVIRRFCRGGCGERIEQGRFADIRQSDNATTETHERRPFI